VATLAEKLRARETQLVDVREPGEWASGHVQGSCSLPLHRLKDPDAIATDSTAPLAVVCAGGMRAAFAASVIRRQARSEVIRVTGGGVGHLPSHEIPLVND
jgi:rhodanese-related sulfurtransferase